MQSRSRWREKERGAEIGRKTDGKDDNVGFNHLHHHATHHPCTVERDKRDYKRADRRLHDSFGRVKRDPEQCAGRCAAAPDVAQSKVPDGELVHRRCADRCFQQDILSCGQSGWMCGKCRNWLKTDHGESQGKGPIQG